MSLFRSEMTGDFGWKLLSTSPPCKPAGRVNAIVERKPRMVDAQLRVLFGEAGEPGLNDVGLVVAVGIFQDT